MENPELPSLCGALIDLANERGGPDNITVVAAKFEGEALAEPNAAEDVGYQVYNIPEGEAAEEPAPAESATEPVTALPSESPAEVGRPRGLLVMAALLAVIALLLTVLL